MIAHNGEAETKEWLEGVKANLARKPQGNDRAQVKAIKEGLCDVSLGNSYYLGKMVNDKEQKLGLMQFTSTSLTKRLQALT